MLPWRHISPHFNLGRFGILWNFYNKVIQSVDEHGELIDRTSFTAVLPHTSCLSNSPPHCGAGVHRNPPGARPGVQPHLPPAASSPGPPPAIRVEAGLPPPHRRTVQRPARRHQLPGQSSEPGRLRRVHLWHHQRGRGRALHLPGHRWVDLTQAWWDVKGGNLDPDRSGSIFMDVRLETNLNLFILI